MKSDNQMKKNEYIDWILRVGLAVGLSCQITHGQVIDVRRAALSERVTSAGAVQGPLAANMSGLDGERQLMIADVLSFQILEDGDPARRVIVTDSAEVDIPYIGRVKAGGRTCEDLALEVKQRLEKDFYHKATVIVGLDYNAYGSRNPARSARGSGGRGMASVSAEEGYTVMGQISNPGVFPLRADVEFRLSHAILQCGGFQKFANDRRVRVLRRDADDELQTIVVNAKDIMNKGMLEKDILISKGDVIIVDKKLLNF